MSYYIAVDVGGTQIRVASYQAEKLEPLRLIRRRTHSRENTPEETLKQAIKDAWPESKPVKAIGIASPGPIDLAAGTIIKAPNIPQWSHFPAVDFLEREFKVPVYLDNDANLAALGEWRYGAGKGHHDIVYITVSTGIGGGVIINDRLLHGVRGLAAELGHVTVDPNGPQCSCGQYGHLEAFSSGTAIARRAHERIQQGVNTELSKVAHPTARDVAEAAEKGDRLAMELLEDAGKHLGRAFADFLHIFNPSILILGGGVTLSGRYILEPIRNALSRYTMSPEYLEDLVITLAQLGDEPGLVGARVMAESATIG
jgi:glucokinase